MRHATIDKYINALNQKHEGFISCTPIAENVDFIVLPGSRPSRPPYEMYFIKGAEGVYIGAVLDMYQDLHAYIKPEHRKRGYLTRALREVILPHLFNSRERITITIDEDDLGEEGFKNSERVALLLGFQPLAKGEFVLEKSNGTAVI